MFGPGEPHLTLIVGVHGDELAPVRAATTLLRGLPTSRFLRAVQLVIANPGACAIRRRYVETDLNRAFSGVAEDGSYEQRLAHEIATTLPATPFMVDIHSTDFPVPAYGVIALDPSGGLATAPSLTPTGHYVAVDFPCLISAFPGAQAFEVGCDHDPRTEVVARELMHHLLTQSGCLDDPPRPQLSSVQVHRITDLLHKKGFATLAELHDFQAIRAGETLGFALDGVERCAVEDCVPVWVNHPTAIRLAESISVSTRSPLEDRSPEQGLGGKPS